MSRYGIKINNFTVKKQIFLCINILYEVDLRLVIMVKILKLLVIIKIWKFRETKELQNQLFL